MDYDKQIEDARSRLAELEKRRVELEKQRSTIDREVLGLTKLIEVLAFLRQSESESSVVQPKAQQESDEPPGLTDTIRLVLHGQPWGLTPVEIRNFIVNTGRISPKTDKLLLINIHTALKRLEKQREIEPFERADGEHAYRPMSEFKRFVTQDTPSHPTVRTWMETHDPTTRKTGK